VLFFVGGVLWCFTVITLKNVKYAYQEWLHSVDIAFPHSQKAERRREHGNTIINFKIDATNN
jgi:hypothetical protein